MAIDLPGFGRSNSDELEDLIDAKLLREVWMLSDTYFSRNSLEIVVTLMADAH